MEMGGVEKVMLSLLNNLDREKFNLTVLLNLNQGELRDEIPAHVRKLWLVEGKEDLSKNTLLQKIQLLRRKNKLESLLKNPKKIDEEILKQKYDIEIAMTYNDFAPVLNSTNKNSKKIGWFHSEINVPKLQPLVPGILKHFPQFHHMVYCSQRTKDLMHEHYPNLDYPPESVITNAIPVEEILQKSDEKIHDFPTTEVPVFVSVGRLHTRKGYHKLIDAHAQLLSEGYPHKVLVIGDGEEKEILKRQISERDVAQTFILVGNRMNPYPYIKTADYFIMPSESEAWPLVLAEALILQKPVIATDTGDVAAMIEDGKTGLLINYNTEAIATAMKTFLSKPELPESFKINLKNIPDIFNNDKIFSKIEEIMLNLAEK